MSNAAMTEREMSRGHGGPDLARLHRHRLAGRVATARALLYSSLAQFLAMPSEAICRAIADGTFQAAISAAVAAAPRAHRSAGMTDAIAKLTADGDAFALREALLVDYTRLFGTDLHCAHYEADYVAGGSFRLSHVIAELVRFYSAFGVKVSDTAHERPDHIAIELDFMNFLSLKEAHARHHRREVDVRQSRRAQRLFLRAHLGRWGRAFARAFRDAAKVPSYGVISELLEKLLAAEAAYHGIDLAVIERCDMAGHEPGSETRRESACERCSVSA